MRAKRSLIALLASLALVAGASTLVPPTATAATKVNPFTVSPKPIKNEVFEAKGKLKTAEIRPVRLQRKSSGVWKTVETVTSSSTGFYRTHGSTAVDRYFRIYVPAATVDGKARKAIKGTAKLVKVVAQTSKITMSDPTPAGGQSVVVKTYATPVREGRAVQVIVSPTKDPSDGGVVETLNQDSNGRATWSTAAPTNSEIDVYYFFAKVVAANGASGKTSPALKVVVH